jgi:hypothetical protein
MIQAFARLLGEEIADAIKRRTAETPLDAPGTSPKTQVATKFTPAFNRALPLLRIYMTWLCSYGTELVEFQPHLEPQFGIMGSTLANTLTLLFELMAIDQQLGNTVPWRFPEDEMALGIRCLNGPELHAGCQLSYDAFTQKLKPLREEVTGTNYGEDDVSFTRSLDVLLCALDLSTPESKFPLATSTITKGSRELTTFVYLENGKPEPAPAVPAVPDPALTTAPPVIEQPAQLPVAQMPVVAPSPCESTEYSEDQEFYGPALSHAAATNGARVAKAPPVTAPAPAVPVSEFPLDRQMFTILNDFINPPESAPAAKPETPTRYSARMNPYGMDSAGVAEAFGAGAGAGAGATTSPAPGSASAKAFPTLPWDYFYTPAPVDSALRNPGSYGAAAGWGANGSGAVRPASSGNAARLGTGTTTGNPPARQTHHQRYDSLNQSRLVENQAEALQFLDLGSDRDQPLQGYGSQGVWPNAAAEGSTSARAMASNPLQQNPWGPSGNPWQSTYGQAPATGGRVPTSPFSTMNFSGNTSSLPQINSPWGLQTAAQRFSATQSPTSPSRLAAYPGVSMPSPSDNRYAGDYATAMAAAADAQASPAFAGGVWSDARQPRNGFAAAAAAHQQQPLGLDVWGNLNRLPAVGEKADAKSVAQGMPKR